MDRLPENWRDLVVAEARSWVKTPYHHLADVKGVGVDCAMLTWRVFHDLDLFDVPDPRPYPFHWHLHRDEERYLLNFETWACPRTAETALPGDIVLFKFGRTVSHSGVLTTETSMVHAHAGVGCWEDEVRTYADRLHSYWSIEQ